MRSKIKNMNPAIKSIPSQTRFSPERIPSFAGFCPSGPCFSVFCYKSHPDLESFRLLSEHGYAIESPEMAILGPITTKNVPRLVTNLQRAKSHLNHSESQDLKFISKIPSLNDLPTYRSRAIDRVIASQEELPNDQSNRHPPPLPPSQPTKPQRRSHPKRRQTASPDHAQTSASQTPQRAERYTRQLGRLIQAYPKEAPCSYRS
jgi:hypothetical protein